MSFRTYLLQVGVVMTMLNAIPAQSLAEPASAQEAKGVTFESFQYAGVDRLTEEVQPKAFLNPILAGFYPDPSICRAGDDYYLINSSFAYFPGIPIFHSRDLVHWRQIGHVIDRPSQAQAMRTIRVSGGIFAPAISYHGGKFYVVCTQVGREGGNFVVAAERPEGPWSDPIWFRDVPGIDPSLFFDDDGSVYIVHNAGPPDEKPLYSGHRAIWLQQVDLKTGQSIGSRHLLINGGTDLSRKPIWIEGPHLFKRDGWFILIAAEGGTGPNHSEVVFRSRSLFGPYEPYQQNPILTQRNLPRDRPEPITCVGHADLVELPNGDWWAMFLGCRTDTEGYGMLGRETFMLPVTWRDGWPMILEPGLAVPRVVPRPALSASTPEPAAHHPTTGTFALHDEFDKPQLDLAWMQLRTPSEAWYSLNAKPGALVVAPRPVPLWERQNPSFVCRRVQHLEYSAETTLSVPPGIEDCEAGLAMFLDEGHHFFQAVRMRGGTMRELFIERVLIPRSDATDARPASQPTTQGVDRVDLPEGCRRISLRARGAGRSITFSYRLGDDTAWRALGQQSDASFLTTRVAGGFTGVCVGMHARRYAR